MPKFEPTVILRRAFASLVCMFFAVSLSYAQQSGPCPAPTDLNSNVMPEIASNGTGLTAGQIVLRDDFRALPGTTTAAGTATCAAQLLRYFGTGPIPPTPAGTIAPSPQLGPTIRASLGDVVQLTFLNQIDPLDYGQSIDSGEKTGQCDSSSTGYPNKAPDGKALTDSYPNCFHGSTTANLHFHGTHTSPTTSADNVFVGVVPSPRANGAPLVTAATFDYTSFYNTCAQTLHANPLLQYPQLPTALGPWPSKPDQFWGKQLALLTTVDANWPNANLVSLDTQALNAGQWPPYYAGSYPYCLVLPRYNPTTTPNLKMGQSPGTHWYHAHKHGSTAIDLFNGMSGAFIVEDNQPASGPNGAPGYDYYFNNGGKVAGVNFAGYNGFRSQLGLSTAKTWSNQQPILIVNEFGGTPPLENGGAGPLLPFSVNGMPNATMTMQPGEVKLWRIVNASPIMGIYINAASLPAGFKWQQTAQDGVQFDDGNFQSRAGHAVFIAPGNRIDLLVQAPQTAVTAPFNVIYGKSVPNALGAAAKQTIPLFAVNVAGIAVSGMALPAHLAARPQFLADIDTSKLKVNRSLVFNTVNIGNSTHTINGAKFDPAKPQETVQLGKTEEWLIVNTTTAGGQVAHPFHIHINPFQVTSVFDPNASLTANGQATGTALYSVSKTDPATQKPWVYTGANKTPRSAFWVKAGTTYSGQCYIDPTPVAGSMLGPAPKGPTGWTPPAWNPSWVQCDAPAAGTPVTATPPAPTKSAGTNIWWDVFPTPAGKAVNGEIVAGYFTMASNFVDYKGEFVLHCHILAHEDRGMMMSVEVTANCPNGVCVPSKSQHATHH